MSGSSRWPTWSPLWHGELLERQNRTAILSEAHRVFVLLFRANYCTILAWRRGSFVSSKRSVLFALYCFLKHQTMDELLTSDSSPFCSCNLHFRFNVRFNKRNKWDFCIFGTFFQKLLNDSWSLDSKAGNCLVMSKIAVGYAVAFCTV